MIKTFVSTNKVESGRVVISTISTVGGFMPAPCPFETMVFEACADKDEVLRYTSLDHNGYWNEPDATKGHEALVKAWSA